MESMDVLECMIRDRLSDARTRARVAALLVDANGSQDPNTAKVRLTDLGGALVEGVRKVMSEISHTLPGRARIAKHP